MVKRKSFQRGPLSSAKKLQKTKNFENSENSESSKIRLLIPKYIKEGTIFLAAIRSISQKEIKVSLQNAIYAYLPTKEFFNQKNIQNYQNFNQIYSKKSQNFDENSENFQNLQNFQINKSKLEKLSMILKNQLILVKIVQVVTEPMLKLKATANPEKINVMRRVESIGKNDLIYSFIDSVEENGFSLTTGISGLSAAFLPSRNIQFSDISLKKIKKSKKIQKISKITKNNDFSEKNNKNNENLIKNPKNTSNSNFPQNYYALPITALKCGINLPIWGQISGVKNLRAKFRLRKKPKMASNSLEFEALHVGALVKCKIGKIFDNAIKVKFLEHFSGIIDEMGLNGKAFDYKIGDEIKARIVMIDPFSKMIQLSNRKHILKLKGDFRMELNIDKIQTGTIFKKVALNYNNRINALFLTANNFDIVKNAFDFKNLQKLTKNENIDKIDKNNNNDKIRDKNNEIVGKKEKNDEFLDDFVEFDLFCPFKQIEDEKNSKVLDQNAIISRHHKIFDKPCRVYDISRIDGRLLVSSKFSVLSQDVFSINDIKVGSIVRAKVLQFKPYGVLVSLTTGTTEKEIKDIKGVISSHLISDYKNVNPLKKFEVDKIVKCRVIYVDFLSNRIFLTTKKSLLNDNLPIVTDDYPQINMITNGTISAVSERGIFVNFYNGISGFITMKEYNNCGYTESPTEIFHQGQTAKVRIKSVLPKIKTNPFSSFNNSTNFSNSNSSDYSKQKTKIFLTFDTSNSDKNSAQNLKMASLKNIKNDWNLIDSLLQKSQFEKFNLGDIVVGTVRAILPTKAILTIKLKSGKNDEKSKNSENLTKKAEKSAKTGKNYIKNEKNSKNDKNSKNEQNIKAEENGEEISDEIVGSDYVNENFAVATLQFGHFSDFKENADFYASNLKMGDIIENLIIYDLNAKNNFSNVLVSKKESVKRCVDLGLIAESYLDLEEGSIRIGFVDNKTKYGLFIKLVGGLCALYPNFDKNDLETNQTVFVKIIKSKGNNKIICSLTQNDICSVYNTLKSEFYFEDFIKENDEIICSILGENIELKEKIGEKFKGKITKKIFNEFRLINIKPLKKYNFKSIILDKIDENEIGKKMYFQFLSILRLNGQINDLTLIFKKCEKTDDFTNFSENNQTEISNFEDIEIVNERFYVCRSFPLFSLKSIYNFKVDKEKIIFPAKINYSNSKINEIKCVYFNKKSLKTSKITKNDKNNKNSKNNKISKNYEIFETPQISQKYQNAVVEMVDLNGIWLKINNSEKSCLVHFSQISHSLTKTLQFSHYLSHFNSNFNRNKLKNFEKTRKNPQKRLKMTNFDPLGKNDIENLENYEYAVGKTVKVDVFGESSGLLFGSFKNLEKLNYFDDKIEKNDKNFNKIEKNDDFIICRVKNIYNNVWAVVEIGYRKFGRVHITLMRKDWESNQLKNDLKEGDYLKVYNISSIFDFEENGDFFSPFSPQQLKLSSQFKQLSKKSNDFKLGELVYGFVKYSDNIKGVFITLNPFVDALVYKKDTSDNFIENLKNKFPVGQLVKSKVIQIKDGRIRLTLKQSEIEKEKVIKSLLKGMEVEGKITAVNQHGIFVVLSKYNISALCRFCDTNQTENQLEKNIKQYSPKIGQKMIFKIKKINAKSSKIDLSLKETEIFENSSNFEENKQNLNLIAENFQNENSESDSENSENEKLKFENDEIPSLNLKDFKDEFDQNLTNFSQFDQFYQKNSEILNKNEKNDKNDKNDKKSQKINQNSTENDQINQNGQKTAKNDQIDSIAAKNNILEMAESLVKANPNSAEAWLEGMARLLKNSLIEEAKSFSEEALAKIDYQNTAGRIKIWVENIMLEIQYGSVDSYCYTLKEAIERQNSKSEFFNVLIDRLIKEKKYNLANGVYSRNVAADKHNFEKWLQYATFLLKNAAFLTSYAAFKQNVRPEDLAQSAASVVFSKISEKSIKNTKNDMKNSKKNSNENLNILIKRALQIFDKEKHPLILAKFAKIELINGGEEIRLKARATFENILETFSGHSDCWMVWIDAEISFLEICCKNEKFEISKKEKMINHIEKIFEKALEQNWSMKKAKPIFARQLNFATKFCGREKAEQIKNAARKFVEKKKTEREANKNETE